MPALASPLKQPERLKMIEQALKDRAPKTYRELKVKGELRSFLKDRERDLMESYEQAESEIISRLSGPKGPKNYQEKVKQLATEQNEAWHQSLETWLEFSDETTESPMES